MLLKKIKISNYRNLDGVEFEFCTDINFFVGENNIGKSNALHAINNVFNAKRFEEDDFYDDTKSIRFDFKILLSDDEIGKFDDFTNPNDIQTVDIYYEQIDFDSPPTFKHLQTNQIISPSMIKDLLVIDYDSIRNPKNEISFQKSKGAASLLNYMIKKYVDENKTNYLNLSKIKNVENYLNCNLEKIIPSSKYGIKTKAYSDNAELLSSILSFVDENEIDISKMGYGIQYNVLIVLSIFEKIISFLKRNKNSNEIHSISALIILDEPEIHLHPHMQRSLISYIQKICSGLEGKFNDLLQKMFGIDEFKAQIFISTHSPSIINNDYKKIFRFYKDCGRTKVVSTNNIELTNSEEKQLLIQYHYVKEVLFARGALIFEGDSEYWSFLSFSKTLGYELDQLGIALIHANGANSIVPLMKLLGKLEIKCVGVIDADKKNDVPAFENIYYTTQLCFDSEIVATLIRKKKIDILHKIVNDNCNYGINCMLQKSLLLKINKKYKLVPDFKIVSDIKLSSCNIPSLRGQYFLNYVTWFSSNKGAVFSKYLGEVLTEDLIPYCYKKAIKKIVSLVK